jgi:DNA invertase Pin-like site-specific DNA recombinase
MVRRGKRVGAAAYMRTSSATNVGQDKDSERRQRLNIAAFAKSCSYTIADNDWFYDAAVSGADPVGERPGFAAMLKRIATNGVRTIIVESPDRFARDLAVQLTGHDFLKKLGVQLVPATAPDFFMEDTPTAVLVRQVLGAIAQFEKASLVAKLKAARERKRELAGKCEGRKSYAELAPDMVKLAQTLRGKRLSLRKVSAELAQKGYLTAKGQPFSASAVKAMIFD